MTKKTSLLMQIGYSVYDRVRRRIAEDCGWVCAYCGGEVTVNMSAGMRLATIDHKIPLSRGGSWKRYNLTCACKRCNQEKSNMTAEEYLAWIRPGIRLEAHSR